MTSYIQGFLLHIEHVSSADGKVSDWQRRYFQKCLDCASALFVFKKDEKEGYSRSLLKLLERYNYVPQTQTGQQDLLIFFEQALKYDALNGDALNLLKTFAGTSAEFSSELFECEALLKRLAQQDCISLLQKNAKLPNNDSVQNYLITLFVKIVNDHQGVLPNDIQQLLNTLIQSEGGANFFNKIMAEPLLRDKLSLHTRVEFVMNQGAVPAEPQLQDELIDHLINLLHDETNNVRVTNYLHAIVNGNPSFIQKVIERPTLYQCFTNGHHLHIAERDLLPANEQSLKHLVVSLTSLLPLHGERVTTLVRSYVSRSDAFAKEVCEAPELFKSLSAAVAFPLMSRLNYIPQQSESQIHLISLLKAGIGLSFAERTETATLLNQFFAVNQNFDEKLKANQNLIDHLNINRFAGPIEHLNRNAQIIIHQQRYLKLLDPNHFKALDTLEALEAFSKTLHEQAAVVEKFNEHPRIDKQVEFLDTVVELKNKSIKLGAKGKTAAAKAASDCAHSMMRAARLFFKDYRDDTKAADKKLKDGVSTAMKKAYPELKQHRGAGIAMANIGIALAGLVTGVLPYLIVLIVHKVKSKHWAFFYKTDSVKKLHCAERVAEEQLIENPQTANAA